MNDISNKTLIIILIIIAPLLLLQGAWIFRDAKKRGEKNYWLWGFFGILHLPDCLIIYLLVTRIIFPRRKKRKKGL